jgi:hypothetical protein
LKDLEFLDIEYIHVLSKCISNMQIFSANPFGCHSILGLDVVFVVDDFSLLIFYRF